MDRRRRFAIVGATLLALAVLAGGGSPPPPPCCVRAELYEGAITRAIETLGAPQSYGANGTNGTNAKRRRELAQADGALRDELLEVLELAGVSCHWNAYGRLECRP